MVKELIILGLLTSCVSAQDGSIHLLSGICLSGDGCSLCLEEK